MSVRDAASRKERCNIPKKYFLKIGDPPDSMLTSKNNKTCIKSDHPSVFICDKEPEQGQARITHRKITKKLKNIKKKELKRKKKWRQNRQKRLRAERMKKKERGMKWGRNRGNGKFVKRKDKRNRKNMKKRNKNN